MFTFLYTEQCNEFLLVSCLNSRQTKLGDVIRRNRLILKNHYCKINENNFQGKITKRDVPLHVRANVICQCQTSVRDLLHIGFEVIYLQKESTTAV